MGYWCTMQIDTGGEFPDVVDEIGNMTSNVAGMWELALDCPLRELNGKLGEDLIPILERAVGHIRDPANEEVYKAMNPKNGWGNHECATDFLERILASCCDRPKAFLVVS